MINHPTRWLASSAVNWCINSVVYRFLSGWWCNNHLEKYEFVNGKDYPIYYIWKVNNVPNHHPVIMVNNMVSPLIFHPQMNNDEHALIQLVSEFKKMFYVYLDHIYIFGYIIQNYVCIYIYRNKHNQFSCLARSSWQEKLLFSAASQSSTQQVLTQGREGGF